MADHADATTPGGDHVFPVRVYYEDTDAAGMVYYANYLKFAERARTELLRDVGHSHRRLRDEHGVVFVVRRCLAEFIRPARLDDRLEVHSRITGMRGAAFDAEQQILREEVLMVHVDVVLACVSTGGRPVRVPRAVRAALQQFTDDSEQSA